MSWHLTMWRIKRRFWRLCQAALLGVTAMTLILLYPGYAKHCNCNTTSTYFTELAIIDRFLTEYSFRCQSEEDKTGDSAETHTIPICPCLPLIPVGRSDVETWYTNLGGGLAVPSEPDTHSLPLLHAVGQGGHWKPSKCRARQKVAILVPFRNRHQHLSAFTQYMHPFLQRQYLDYTIFIIEQKNPEIFNRAALMNIGFLEANKISPNGFDCYIFHDVDLLPEDNRNMYTCYMSPIHLGAYMNKYDYRLWYPHFLGGALGLSRSDILAINGFPNGYFGWGGEDDAIFERLMYQNMTIHRYPPAVGSSYMFKHGEDEDNPKNPMRYVLIEEDNFNYDGLSTVKYTRTRLRRTTFYTMISVNIIPEYDPKCIIDIRKPPEVNGNYINCRIKENYYTGLIECCTNATDTFCCADKSRPKTRQGGSWLLVFILTQLFFISGILIYIRIRHQHLPVKSLCWRYHRKEAKHDLYP